MNDPESYLDFLNNVMDEGRKVIVFDNFGAYQDRRTGEFIDNGRLNLTLSRLGLLYFGDWTDDGSVIRIAFRDSEMAEKGGRQSPDYSRLYYRFIQSDQELEVYLSLRRTDRTHTPARLS
jgi:hypothetical protein